MNTLFTTPGGRDPFAVILIIVFVYQPIRKYPQIQKKNYATLAAQKGVESSVTVLGLNSQCASGWRRKAPCVSEDREDLNQSAAIKASIGTWHLLYERRRARYHRNWVFCVRLRHSRCFKPLLFTPQIFNWLQSSGYRTSFLNLWRKQRLWLKIVFNRTHSWLWAQVLPARRAISRQVSIAAWLTVLFGPSCHDMPPAGVTHFEITYT